MTSSQKGTNWTVYGVIINDYTIVVGVGGLVECAASFIISLRLASPIALVTVVKI
jgi:hypothetical protein